MSDAQVSTGMNRTGAQMSPEDVQAQEEATRHFPADVPGDVGQYTEARQRAILDADPLGSVAPPGSTKGMLKNTFDKMLGKNPQVLLDKLGERLAFERAGVRLYEAMIAKATSAQGADPSLVSTLREIQAQELEHMNIVRDAIETLGADPTSVTPCADLVGVKAMGILQVLTDPRTTLSQSLSAILTIELEDNAAWSLLVELCNHGGHPMIADRFEQAQQQEEMHLTMIRGAVRQDLFEQLS
ncbi:ferritin-like domain-containing protein [Pseudomonas sp. DTU_2021_1001937_2_SI_NGA_ILE_001]|uniref:ferritin-like domain-containing protein n=1 Tax=Pseudomonas sp. DTU_2021_1001937_2_SI_NGA_ILE_001 TaxID=3077589 RepID=UPI0028FC24A4|nr:ferritin-like domain-containing protein [Pseudomonas sp. DTU_2021_1001937_2_SI_NGA_ILE_001]WNW13430.1 ferritin-like domain-containing protein [Pseudomonas sp. DTU_2021_1001937_2_SI_NGA_ILE_001]